MIMSDLKPWASNLHACLPIRPKDRTDLTLCCRWAFRSTIALRENRIEQNLSQKEVLLISHSESAHRESAVDIQGLPSHERCSRSAEEQYMA